MTSPCSLNLMLRLLEHNSLLKESIHSVRACRCHFIPTCEHSAQVLIHKCSQASDLPISNKDNTPALHQGLCTHKQFHLISQWACSRGSALPSMYLQMCLSRVLYCQGSVPGVLPLVELWRILPWVERVYPYCGDRPRCECNLAKCRRGYEGLMCSSLQKLLSLPTS